MLESQTCWTDGWVPTPIIPQLVTLASRDDPRTILPAMALPGITAFLAETVDQGLSLCLCAH